MLAIFVPIGFAAEKEDEPIKTIIKIGYQSLSDSLGGADLDGSGLSVSLENLISEDSFASFYAAISRLSYDASANGLSVDIGDADTVGFGLKYNFAHGDITDYSAGLKKGMVYARLGWERADLSASSTLQSLAAGAGAPLGATSASESGMLIGLGYEKLFESLGAFIEWKRHDEDALDDDSITIGAFFKF